VGEATTVCQQRPKKTGENTPISFCEYGKRKKKERKKEKHTHTHRKTAL